MLQWCYQVEANNSRRQRLSLAHCFYAWAVREGYWTGRDPTAGIATRRFPTTYGKAQSKNPARFLTRDEADRLIAATSDGTWVGSRNQLIVRLGLIGMRAAEIRGLTWGALSGHHLHWTGKANRPRRMTVSSDLTQLLTRWRRHYERQLGRPIALTDPVICRQHDGSHELDWGLPVKSHHAIFHTVTSAARTAGLGHVTPHDLRRTAASILHNARSPQGAHYFDLLDIQQVLGHTDPAVTMRSYLAPMNTEVLDRAAEYLG